MTSCSHYRKLIACTEASALDAHEESQLQVHLKECEGCRHYHADISHLIHQLGKVEVRSDIQTSAAFHQRVLGALRAEAKVPAWQRAWIFLQESFGNWRVGLSASAAAAILLVTLFLSLRHRETTMPVLPVNLAAQNKQPKSDPGPTILHYQTVANRSLDKLDELLNREGTRSPLASPVYTASSLNQVDQLE